MRKALLIGSIFFSLAAVSFVFKLSSLGYKGNEYSIYFNIAAGCGIKAFGLWISFFSRCDDMQQTSSVCLKVSGIICLLLLMIILSGGLTGLFFLLCTGFGAAAILLTDLIVFSVCKVIAKSKM